MLSRFPADTPLRAVALTVMVKATRIPAVARTPTMYLTFTGSPSEGMKLEQDK